LKKEVSKMEKALVVLAAVLMVFGFSMVGFAYDLNTVGASNQVWKMAGEFTCGPSELYVGEVAWVYPGTERMMVNGPDGSKIFDLSKATFRPFKVPMKDLPEADQFVKVNYTVVNGDRIASSVTEIPRQVASLYVGEG